MLYVFSAVYVNNEYTLMSTVGLPTCINIVYKSTILHLTQQRNWNLYIRCWRFIRQHTPCFSLKSVHLLSQPWFAFVLDLTWNTPRSRTPVILQMIQMYTYIIMGGVLCAKSVEMGGIWYHHKSPINKIYIYMCVCVCVKAKISHEVKVYWRVFVKIWLIVQHN